jgi:hypothetical protein
LGCWVLDRELSHEFGKCSWVLLCC